VLVLENILYMNICRERPSNGVHGYLDSWQLFGGKTLPKTLLVVYLPLLKNRTSIPVVKRSPAFATSDLGSPEFV